MKRTIVLFSAVLLLFSSCKNTENNEVAEDIQEIKGEFIFLDDAAVLMGRDFIYGVKIDDMALELASRVEPVKKEEFDMVPVIVKATIEEITDKEDTWSHIITIKEIVRVSTRPSQPDVKLE